MISTSKIAVVILNWNGEKLFSEFLPSIIENTKSDNTEIIVADNNSSDQSVHFLQQNFPTVKIIKLDKNYGFAEGYNRALSQVSADYFVLLNSDIKVTRNWLEPCIERFEKDKEVAAIQPKILSYKQPEKFEYAGAGGGFIDKFGYPFCRGRILDHLETDNGQYDESTQIFWASGACMFLRAQAFKEAGGFDGDFWAHMEEIDLCWRLKNSGFKVIYEPESVTYHLGGGTLSYGSPKKIYLNFRNNLWMLFKNLPEYKFKRIFFVRLVLDGVAALKFLAGLEYRAFWAVLKAHFFFYKNLAKLLKKRKAVQKTIVKKDHNEVYPKSIMWKFFIQKIYYFSELKYKPE